MSSAWVVAASQLAGAALDLFSTRTRAKSQKTMAGAIGRVERSQIALSSYLDSQQRIRQTGSLISAQRAGLAASGVAGGRTSRLLEAQARMAASREQFQADASAIYQRGASRLREQQQRAAASEAVTRSTVNLFQTGLDTASWLISQPKKEETDG